MAKSLRGKGRTYVYKTRKDKGTKRRKKISLTGRDPAFIRGFFGARKA